MNRRNYLMLALVLALPVSLHTATAKKKSGQAKPVKKSGATAKSAAVKQKLVGVWQAAPAMGAGWSTTYRFFSSGHFEWHASQMNCEARTIGRSGSWKVQGNNLVTATAVTTILQGGKLQPATGSCGSKMEIVGAKKMTAMSARAVMRVLPLSPVVHDKSNKRLMVRIGKTRFWKYETDPRRYP